VRVGKPSLDGGEGALSRLRVDGMSDGIEPIYLVIISITSGTYIMIC
jgi:hypothetical protein